MIMKDALCKAFCDSLVVREVPAGLSVGTNFRQTNGDRVGFYIVFDKHDQSRARIEDDGQTMPMLEATGVDLLSGPRAEAFLATLKQSRVLHDPEENVLHTDFMPIDQLPFTALGFVACLIRMQEFFFLTRENIESTFKNDVIKAIQDHFVERAVVYVEDQADAALPHSRADVVIAPPGTEPLAIFIGTSESRALEATVLHSDVLAGLSTPCKVMLVLETSRPKRIPQNTLDRAQTRFSVPIFKGLREEALARMDRDLGVSGTVH
jgi:hypothetical protein